MALKIKCPNHPRYNGTKSPKASCGACQEIQRIRLGVREAGLMVVEVTKAATEVVE